MTGAPFTVYSGIQQTGAGSNNADRPDASRPARPLHQPHRSRRLFRPRRRQQFVLFNPDQRPRRLRTQQRPLRHARTQHLPRSGVPQLRFLPHQEHPHRTEIQPRAHRPPIPLRSLQRLQHRQLQPPLQHRPRPRLRSHLPHRRPLPSTAVVIENLVLSRHSGRLTFQDLRTNQLVCLASRNASGGLESSLGYRPGCASAGSFWEFQSVEFAPLRKYGPSRSWMSV